jgi:hypothetical protein
MAGDWMKVRVGLRRDLTVFRLARVAGVSPDEMVAVLHELAGWFATQGEYGKMKYPASIIDSFCGFDGFAAELQAVGWLKDHNGTLCLRGFCQVSATRKSLGAKIRSQILDGAVCACCGTTSELVIDHIIPIVRGGSCDTSNLQALCRPCNARKGRKTMAEFMAEVAP